MDFVDYVNKIYKEKNKPHNNVDLHKVAQGIIKDVKWQFTQHPREEFIGRFGNKKAFVVYVSFFIYGENEPLNKEKHETFISYDSGYYDITYVYFSSKYDYNQVFSCLQHLCAADGITVQRHNYSFCFTIPKKL